jgi:hypothetical protein
MTEKDFCRFVWEEFKVIRFKSEFLYSLYNDSIFDSFFVYSNVDRDYDRLNIDWKSIDRGKTYQELGKELYNKFNNT